MQQAEKIDRLKVTNFQSVENADIEVGGLTVIVGHSNSGKSALVRALRAVARNVNAPSAVRAGKKVFTVAVHSGDTTVSIERGKSQSTYRVSKGSEEAVYTKAGRSVPDEVQKALALPVPEGPDLTFSGQIDPPFLLAESGSVVAKVLGDLTNVSRLHAASKEANRRRLEATKIVKIRKEDAVGAASRLQEEFGTLQEDAQRVREARAALEEVRVHAQTAEALRSILSDLEMASAAERDLQARVEGLPEPADIEEMAERAGELIGAKAAIQNLLQNLAACDDAEVRARDLLAEANRDEESLGEEYRTALAEAGECPVCGQSTEELVA